MVKWVLEWSDDDVEFVNMKDDDGNTPLHISAAKKANSGNKYVYTRRGNDCHSQATVAPITQSSNTPNCLKNKSSEKNHNTWLREGRGALMGVAILNATVTFEAGINPPRGDNGDNGRYKGNGNDGNKQIKRGHIAFMVIDTTGLLVSLSIITLLISKPPLQSVVLMRVLKVLMWISVSSVI
ncbi:ankyrin repeat-containing protein NPR4-like protein [Cinnamomum micranthum f. kanehirae]|uniref:Ankyrin repeat-containing protein NPR4-like protein n=1 Tax=Cinnamomum micranthum f. kanehirae TaxID=337451 RepID=A0A443PHG1_9MAGN|nr:ankyrin repeat-containing protein NPR4-like protein [Cinnamomum micranthum f. kanehirae]